MATNRQNADFANQIICSDPLDVAIEWINANLSPGDVFSDDELASYATTNIDIDTAYSDVIILDYVKRTFTPEDVFDARELAAWAEQNGYSLES